MNSLLVFLLLPSSASALAAPPIDWQKATIASNVPLSRGTFLLTVQPDEPVTYRPGHIIGLSMGDHPETSAPMRGPYTVSRCTGQTFDVIYRVIPDGRKTPIMSGLQPGTSIEFGGKFGVAIADGISTPCDRLIGISTGVGIGPLLGYAEEALASDDGPATIELYAGFADLADVCCADDLDRMAAEHASRFRWTPCISRPMACTAASLNPLVAERRTGRVSTAAPPLIARAGAASLSRSHFHLVGNGQMVKEFEQGLLDGGIGEGRVTTETYFNGKAEPEADVAAHIAASVRPLVAADAGDGAAAGEAVATFGMG